MKKSGKFVPCCHLTVKKISHYIAGDHAPWTVFIYPDVISGEINFSSKEIPVHWGLRCQTV